MTILGLALVFVAIRFSQLNRRNLLPSWLMALLEWMLIVGLIMTIVGLCMQLWGAMQ